MRGVEQERIEPVSQSSWVLSGRGQSLKKVGHSINPLVTNLKGQLWARLELQGLAREIILAFFVAPNF